MPQLERQKAHAEGELMKAVNAMSEREAALSEVRSRGSENGGGRQSSSDFAFLVTLGVRWMNAPHRWHLERDEISSNIFS